MTSTITLLMTRPLASSKRFVAQLPDHVLARLSICYAPLIRIEPIVDQIVLGDAKALIFTSSHAVELASSLVLKRDLPVFCVGRATTQTAIDAGWDAAFLGQTADALVQVVLDRQPTAPILHLSGVHTRGEIAKRLSYAGIKTTAQAIYAQQNVPLTQEALALLDCGSPVIAPLFSPRTARQFAGLVQGHALLRLVALSPEVSNPLNTLIYHSLITCEQPDAMAMCTVVENFVNDAGRVESSPNAQ